MADILIITVTDGKLIYETRSTKEEARDRLNWLLTHDSITDGVLLYTQPVDIQRDTPFMRKV